MTITLNTSNGFAPTSDVGGKKGLHWKKGSTSTATLSGSGLSDGLSVDVLFPQQSRSPTIEWTGNTYGTNSDGTQSTVDLTEQKSNNGPGGEEDTDITVSVTATDNSTQQSSNTSAPTVGTGQ